MDYQEKNVKQVYNEIAHHFNVTRVNNWKWITEFVQSIKSIQINPVIYDFGCGSGRNMMYEGVNFIGIDNCHEFIKICRSKNLNVIESNITRTPLSNKSADAIMCIATFHHIDNNDDRILALLEMSRLLKPSGVIVLSVWSINQPEKTRRHFSEYGDNIVLWNKYGKIYERYYYIFMIDEIMRLFKMANLTIEKHVYDCGNEIFYLKKLVL